MKIKEGKQAYSRKLEQQLQSEGLKQVWSGLRKITGFERKGARCLTEIGMLRMTLIGFLTDSTLLFSLAGHQGLTTFPPPLCPLHL